MLATSVAKTEVVPSTSGASSSFTDTSSSEGFEVIESAEVVHKEAGRNLLSKTKKPINY